MLLDVQRLQHRAWVERDELCGVSVGALRLKKRVKWGGHVPTCWLCPFSRLYDLRGLFFAPAQKMSSARYKSSVFGGSSRSSQSAATRKRDRLFPLEAIESSNFRPQNHHRPRPFANPLRRRRHHNTPPLDTSPSTTAAMSLPSKQAATSLVRHAAASSVRQPALRSSAAVVQKRNRADASTSHANWTSPFSRGSGNRQDTTAIPSFAKYRGGSETGNKMFQYFMVGALGGVTAVGAKNTVQGTFLQDILDGSVRGTSVAI